MQSQCHLTSYSNFFFKKRDSRIDDIVGFSIVGAVFSLLVLTWLKIKIGLRRSIQFSCLLMALGSIYISSRFPCSWLQCRSLFCFTIGGFFCFLSSAPVVADQLSSDQQYWMVVFGQLLSGLGSYGLGLTSDVANNWFDEKGRLLATSLLSLSIVMGTVLASNFTPQLVTNSESMPLMNTVYFIPTIFVTLISFIKVKKRQHVSSSIFKVKSVLLGSNR